MQESGGCGVMRGLNARGCSKKRLGKEDSKRQGQRILGRTVRGMNWSSNVAPGRDDRESEKDDDQVKVKVTTVFDSDREREQKCKNDCRSTKLTSVL